MFLSLEFLGIPIISSTNELVLVTIVIKLSSNGTEHHIHQYQPHTIYVVLLVQPATRWEEYTRHGHAIKEEVKNYQDFKPS
jgi:hypothetical protein